MSASENMTLVRIQNVYGSSSSSSHHPESPGSVARLDKVQPLMAQEKVYMFMTFGSITLH